MLSKIYTIIGGTRTHNLRIRSPARYPLRHDDICSLLHSSMYLIVNPEPKNNR